MQSTDYCNTYDFQHTTLLAQLRRTAAAPVAEFPRECSMLVDRLEVDFRLQDDMMEALGCAGLALLREQHARVLSSLHHALSMLQAGDPSLALHAFHDLALWLPMHLTALDAELANAAGAALPAFAARH